MAAPIEIRPPSDRNIKIVKWKVKKDSMIYKGSVLALYVLDGENADNQVQLKLKASRNGTVSEIVAAENSVINSG